MRFNFRNIDGDKFIAQTEQSHDFLNVLKFFNEEKIPITVVTYKEHEDEDLYEDYIVEDFFLHCYITPCVIMNHMLQFVSVRMKIIKKNII